VSDFDLSSFLAEQASQGESAGLGGFTISHEKAARKMAEYSLPRSHTWVLRLIQAGVGWGCDQIEITQTKLHSTFHFQFSNLSPLPTNQQLVSAILRADLESQSPLDSFATGLRLIVEKSHLSFLLLIDTKDLEPQAIYAGVYFSELSEEKRAVLREDWGVGVTLMIHHISHTNPNRLLLNYVPIENHGIPLVRELDHYAFTCPIPLKVDGRRIEGVFRSGRFAWSGYFKPLRAAGLELPGDEDPRFSICPGFDNRVFGLLTPRRIPVALEASTTAESFFLLAAGKQGTQFQSIVHTEQSALYWVRNGVVVDQDVLPLRSFTTKLFIFASAEGLKSDLTGFQLIDNEEKSGRKQRVISRIVRALELEVAANRDILMKPPDLMEMNDEQLQELPVQTRYITKGLNRARRGLEGETEYLAGLREFAKQLVTAAYGAVQTVVSEPEHWIESRFPEVYPEELSSIVSRLKKALETESVGVVKTDGSKDKVG